MDPDRQVGESDLETGVGTFLRLAGSSMIHENAPHQSCGYREKMRPALPGDPVLVDQSKIDLMNQISSLEAASFGFPRHVAGCQPMQLTVDDAEQPILHKA